MTTKFEQELQMLKPEDEIITTTKNPRDKGFEFISTLGHGYLIVPQDSPHIKTAKKIYDNSGCGFEGKLAIYLEEDGEAPEFINQIP